MEGKLTIRFCLAASFIFAWQIFFAQNDAVDEGMDSVPELRVSLMGFTTGDSIILRWAPQDLYTWNYANRYGYTLERQTLRSAGTKLSDEQVERSTIDFGDFFPLDSSAWSESLDTNDRWENLAAGSLYGDFETFDPSVPPGSFEYYQNQSIALTNRFSFHLLASAHSMKAAKKLGEAYVDYDVTKGDSYLYRISFNASSKELPVTLRHDHHLVYDNQLELLPEIDSVLADCQDSLVILEWNEYGTHASYVSYDIFKSKRRDGEFQRVNKVPVVSGKFDDYRLIFSDSLNNNVDSFYYKVQGISPFGFVGPESKTVAVKGVPKVEVRKSVIRITEELDSGQLIVGWESDTLSNPHVEGFNVHLSNGYAEVGYVVNHELLPPTQRQYLIEDAPTTCYVRVETILKDGGKLMSASRIVNLKDQIPPARPEALKCDLDTANNLVSMQWDWGPEEDIDGYHVMASWSDDQEYHMISDSLLRTSHYTFPIDTRRNGEDFFFSVRATDFRMNDSELAEGCKVTFLDVEAPAPALIRTFNEGRNYISFAWACSPSQDVVSHEIWRKSETSDEWKLLAADSLNQSVAMFTDSTNLKKKLRYSYQITALDGAGNSTPSLIKKGKVWDDGMNENIAQFQLEVASEDLDELMLSWKYFPPELIEKFIVYRTSQTDDWKTHLVLNQADLVKISSDISEGLNDYAYVDPLARKGILYAYKMRAVLRDGSRSPMSVIRKIRL